MPIDFAIECEECSVIAVGACNAEETPKSNTPHSDYMIPANRVEDIPWDKPMPKAPKLRCLKGKRPASPPFLCMIGGVDESKRRKIIPGTENTREF